jgi:hypothetical protein
LNVFHFEGIVLEIEEARFNLFEQIILGFEPGSATQYPQKYRITVSYPKTQRAHKSQLQDTEVYYVAAPDVQSAKSKIVDHLKNKKVKPGTTEVADWLKRALRQIRFTNIKQVKNWNDLVQMLHYIAERGFSNPVRFFDQNDLTAFLQKRMGSSDFGAVLQSLPKKEQLVLKRFLKSFLSDPSLSGHELLNAPGRYDKDKTQRELLSKNLFSYGRRGGDRTPDMNKKLWVHEKSSTLDIMRDAKRYGFTSKDLNDAIGETNGNIFTKYESAMSQYQERREAWEYVADLIANNVRRKFGPRSISYKWYSKFIQDHNPDELSEVLVRLDGYESEAISMYPGVFSASNASPTDYYNGLSFDPNDAIDSTEDTVSAQMYSLYQGGPPKKPIKPNMSLLYHQALVRLIDRCKENPETCPRSTPSNSRKKPENSDYTIPF